MPVTIVKKKQVATTKKWVVEMVDAITALKQQLDELKPLQKDLDGKRKELLEKIPAHASPESAVEFYGTNSKVVFSPCSVERNINNMRALHKMLGDDVFYNVCSVKLADVDRYLSEEERAAILTVQFSETRTMSVKPKE